MFRLFSSLYKQYTTIGHRINIYFNGLNRSAGQISSGNIKSIRRFLSSGVMESLNFDNLVLRSLPIDNEKENFVRQVSGACFSKISPTPVENPVTVAYSTPALQLLDIPETDTLTKEFAEYFSGNKILQGSETAAHCYCGHQFGYFSGQLGDGAAIYLGEIINKKKERWEIQLKGAGLTPYSRTADGRKVLRSTIREFLCSEAMHHLGIPTTRAGSCVTSDSMVVRDIFYDGHPIHEKCSIVLRIAPTFLRFGSFEIFKPVDSQTGRKGPSVGRNDILTQMLEYTIKTFYTEIYDAHKDDLKKMYQEFYRDITHRTARLVAEWQCIGWCHGVLNTDNMSIVGVTIDYGPYGFMDRYDPGFICNNSDDGGRYTYEKQPEICKWNLKKLGEAIQGAIPVSETEPILEDFDAVFEQHYMEKMRKKFGLNKELPNDKDLVDSFLATMHKTGADFTNSFRSLSKLSLPGSADFDYKLELLKRRLLEQCCTLEQLKKTYAPRMDPRQLSMMVSMLQMNPDLLNMLGGSAKAVMVEIKNLEKLKEIKDLTDAEKKGNDDKEWTEWLEKYVARLKVEAEGIESIEEVNRARVEMMDSCNPKFILRNYIAQNAIEAAERGDFTEVKRVLTLLENPFSDSIDFSEVEPQPLSQDQEASCSVASTCERPAKSFTGIAYDSPPPDSLLDLRVT
ncbi:unnamed protein product [Owenia fusiformis]|uniref:Selenoprotein O n=1 Tax=Owenia fusiformis TaxID=6347 RepID=A0A8J1YAW3_OWEFU|nr:unnamed protein product [Owenia fusiformis]